MQLYYHPISTFSRIVTLMAADQGIELDLVEVDLSHRAQNEPWFRDLNPNQMIPVLDDDGFILSESGAIIRYLASRESSDAYPADLKRRARVDEILSWFDSQYQRDVNRGFVFPQILPYKYPPSASDPAVLANYYKKASHWLDVIDGTFLGNDRPFLSGDQISLADYAGAVLVAVADLVDFDFSPWRNVSAWRARMAERPAWAQVTISQTALRASYAAARARNGH